MKNGFLPLLASGAVTMGLFACTPSIDQRGYLSDPVIERGVKVGTDTKTTVQTQLGFASITATFGSDTWYYVSSLEKQVAFFTPTVLNRTILAVSFDKDGKVTAIRHYTLKDGHVISFEANETPARGRELTFLQQLLNAQPGSQATPLDQKNPGGGGGPTGGGGGGLP